MIKQILSLASMLSPLMILRWWVICGFDNCSFIVRAEAGTLRKTRRTSYDTAEDYEAVRRYTFAEGYDTAEGADAFQLKLYSDRKYELDGTTKEDHYFCAQCSEMECRHGSVILAECNVEEPSQFWIENADGKINTKSFSNKCMTYFPFDPPMITTRTCSPGRNYVQLMEVKESSEGKNIQIHTNDAKDEELCLIVADEQPSEGSIVVLGKCDTTTAQNKNSVYWVKVGVDKERREGYEEEGDGYEEGDDGYEEEGDGYEEGDDGYEEGDDGYEEKEGDGYEEGEGDGYDKGGDGYETGDGYTVPGYSANGY